MQDSVSWPQDEPNRKQKSQSTDWLFCLVLVVELAVDRLVKYHCIV